MERKCEEGRRHSNIRQEDFGKESVKAAQKSAKKNRLNDSKHWKLNIPETAAHRPGIQLKKKSK
jgi:hypothetical protein